ncbi:MAG TPA: YdbH domain-containing protein [Hyphomonadaceae bacterium]|nr:YdbH domain-containing protein [Hyphomonadaceae bacterium]
MTEEKLRPKSKIASKGRIAGLVLAVLSLFAALVWLFRQPIAEGIGQVVCGQQKLVCKIRLTRLDLGGLTLNDLDVRAPNATDAALSAKSLSIDLNWDGLFSPRASLVGGEELVLRLDLTGTRPILGDLDEAVKAFTKPTAKPGPVPRIDFKTVRVIGVTPLGPVEARGAVAATGPDAFVIDLTAPKAQLGLLGAKLQLAGGELNATVAGGEINAHAGLNLEKFETAHSTISDVKIDASITQSAGVLKGEGEAKVGEVSVQDTRLAGAEAKASVVSSAIDTQAPDLSAWVSGVRSLTLNASAGEGQVGAIAWKHGELKASVAPAESKGSAGSLDFFAEQVALPQGVAGRVELGGKIDIPQQGPPTASGLARVRAGALTASQRKSVADAVQGPFAAILPSFADAAARVADNASQNFEVVAPWSAALTKAGFDFSLLTGSEVRAASGLSVVLDANAGEEQVATYSLALSGGKPPISLGADVGKQAPATPATVSSGQWKASGSVRMSGGGAPQVSLDIGRATGVGADVSLAGAMKLRAWQVNDDVLAAEASGLQFDTKGGAGSAAGQFTVSLDGGMAGGVWKGARATGKVDASWTQSTFLANAPRGLVIQWDKATYGDTVFGAGALHFTPLGKLAERQGDAIVGQGVMSSVEMPITAKAFTATARLGDTAINWRAENGFRAGFEASPSVDLKLGEHPAPTRIAKLSGIVDVRDGWRVTGNFSGGEMKADEANIVDAAAKFDLGGEKDNIDGKLTEVSLRILDPQPEDKRRFEEAKFSGAATLKDSIAGFTGVVSLAKPAIEVAHIDGQHSLKTGAGQLTFAPTPFVFVPRAFQPYHLSPLLRGPASVVGRVDISGGASWDAKGAKAHARVGINNLGFTQADLGVFEGVNGVVEISDLLSMKSEPHQTINLPKVTLGMPIENGVIKFQLIGLDAIRLEGAEWPFVGGFIRVKPVDFKFSEPQNSVTAQAVNWDLNKLVDLFKVPDLKLNGTVNGDIPVTFSTGSAKINDAKLEASQQGGLIQYTGSTGDAAAQSDSNAKMLFDALKDFHYKVLGLGIDGDVAGEIRLSMHLLGNNPTVLNGKTFDLNIGVDSNLMKLLNMTSTKNMVKSQIENGAAQDAVKPQISGAPVPN